MNTPSKQIQPPQIAERLLSFVSDRTIRDSALGDFEEQFSYLAKKDGLAKARLWYWSQVIKSVPAFVSDSIYWSLLMFRNYLLVALRNLRKQKIYSFINIFGLSVGIALSLLVFLFVRHEYSYDTFHEKSDRIVRLWRNLHHPVRGDRPGLFVPYVLGETLKESYPEVANVVRLASLNSTVRHEDQVFTEDLLMTSSEFFDVFSFPILKGNKTNPLQNRNSIVLSETMSKKYFGTENPVGKTLLVQFLDGEEPLIVSAVAADVPENSSIVFDFAVNIEKARDFLSQIFFDSWRAAFAEAYVELNENITIAAFEQNLVSLQERYNAGLSEDFTASVFVQPLSQLHLSTAVQDEVVETSDPKYASILFGLGVFVLFVAGVNFTTLSLGRSLDRAKEVGVRKVMGAFHSQLVKQYLGEALLLGLFSVVVAIGLAQLMLPVFNGLAGKNLAFTFDLPTILLGVLLLLLISGAAGFYPAQVLSRFSPTSIFRQSRETGQRNWLSRGLVMLQFGISVFLIITTLVMRQQLDYLKEKNLGYDRERVVEIDLNSTPEEAAQVLERVRNELIEDERILGVAGTMNAFDSEWPTMGYYDEFDHLNKFVFNLATYDYVRTMGMEIVEGRDFSRAFGTDEEQAILVNQAFLRLQGWQNGLDQPLPDKFNPDMKIVGVVKDFHFSSLHHEIQPLVLTLSRSPLAEMDYGRGVGQIAVSSLVVRIAPGEIQPMVDFLKRTWRLVAPNKPFDLTFLDDTIEAHYRVEHRWSKIIRYTSLCAIVIACLGLFGLASLALERRVKEIGIRKVLGASGLRILALVSKDLLTLVLLANVVAWPAAYLAAEHWLQDFAYRVEIDAAVFAVSSLLALLIAAITLSYQVGKAALTNPVQSLRTE